MKNRFIHALAWLAVLALPGVAAAEGTTRNTVESTIVTVLTSRSDHSNQREAALLLVLDDIGNYWAQDRVGGFLPSLLEATRDRLILETGNRDPRQFSNEELVIQMEISALTLLERDE
jgi:hypothetical protein